MKFKFHESIAKYLAHSYFLVLNKKYKKTKNRRLKMSHPVEYIGVTAEISAHATASRGRCAPPFTPRGLQRKRT